MATATKTAAPRRTTRAATPKAASKPVEPVETPEEESAAPVTKDGLTRVTFVLEEGPETKSYAVFSPPAESGCVGKLYVPKGVTQVKMLLVGPADVVE